LRWVFSDSGFLRSGRPGSGGGGGAAPRVQLKAEARFTLAHLLCASAGGKGIEGIDLNDLPKMEDSSYSHTHHMMKLIGAQLGASTNGTLEEMREQALEQGQRLLMEKQSFRHYTKFYYPALTTYEVGERMLVINESSVAGYNGPYPCVVAHIFPEEKGGKYNGTNYDRGYVIKYGNDESVPPSWRSQFEGGVPESDLQAAPDESSTAAATKRRRRDESTSAAAKRPHLAAAPAAAAAAAAAKPRA